MVLGTPDDPLYYFHLTAIAIDMVQNILVEKTFRRNWLKLPKKTYVKIKIVERLLVTRKTVNGYYVLDQYRLLTMFHNIWGSVDTAHIVHHNDCLRVFGLIMTISENRFMYERLVEGCTARHHIDDPSDTPKHISRKLHLLSIIKI